MLLQYNTARDAESPIGKVLRSGPDAKCLASSSNPVLYRQIGQIMTIVASPTANARKACGGHNDGERRMGGRRRCRVS